MLFPESESFSAATATRGDTLHQNRVWPIVDPFFSSFMASECLNRCISFRLSAPYRPLSFFFARGVFEPPPNRQQRGAAPEVMPKSSRQQGWHIFFCLSLTFNSVSKSPVTNRLAKKYLYVPLLGRYLPSSCFFFRFLLFFLPFPQQVLLAIQSHWGQLLLRFDLLGIGLRRARALSLVVARRAMTVAIFLNCFICRMARLRNGAVSDAR